MPSLAHESDQMSDVEAERCNQPRKRITPLFKSYLECGQFLLSMSHIHADGIIFIVFAFVTAGIASLASLAPQLS